MHKSSKLLLVVKSTIMVAFLFFIDQITKIQAVKALEGGNRIPVINDCLEFYYIKNTGAAFSFMTGHTGFFKIITPIVLLIILFFFFRMPDDKRYNPIRGILLFIIAGALGNWYDRLVFDYVRDFIYFSLIDFPVFNVADIYVTCSCILFLILSIFYYKDDEFDQMFRLKGKQDD